MRTILGKVVFSNQDLLKQIQSHYTSGIYTENDFFEKIGAGFTYFNIRITTDTGKCTLSRNTLESLGRYNGPIFEHKGKLVYKNKNEDKSRFVFELISNGSGCFLTEHEAVSFQKEVLENWKNLISVI